MLPALILRKSPRWAGRRPLAREAARTPQRDIVKLRQAIRPARPIHPAIRRSHLVLYGGQRISPIPSFNPSRVHSTALSCACPQCRSDVPKEDMCARMPRCDSIEEAMKTRRQRPALHRRQWRPMPNGPKNGAGGLCNVFSRVPVVANVVPCWASLRTGAPACTCWAEYICDLGRPEDFVWCPIPIHHPGVSVAMAPGDSSTPKPKPCGSGSQPVRPT